ncbi:MAG TPA: response regulator transcription factor [Candidatus Scatomorpha intestinavium]|uniref:Stage 0 sporulation protein A homolog n=1 Tax=Candidatus Scatomorpha intestinavium TaxID=2840922 RepID=A0A9D1CSV7_9FIRM|nr:response regulator transcription factor [Candidatus Scatomorpha intestinavium]
MRILVVEDERDLNRIISKRLAAAGYTVDSCFNGADALDYLEAAEYDAAIFDVMMPVTDGFTAVRRMRARGDATPVLFLTARDAVSDRVEGLDLGANDYLVKPFAFDELLARIRAMTRRSAGSTTNVFTCGDLMLDTAKHSVERAGRPVDLSAKEFAVLEYLIRNKGSVLSRESIENNVWSYDWEGGTNVVDVYVSYLRRKIDADFDSKLIHTVRGVGWVLREEP